MLITPSETPSALSLSLRLARPLGSERSFVIKGVFGPWDLTTVWGVEEDIMVSLRPWTEVVDTTVVTAILVRLKSFCLLSEVALD